LLDVSEIGGSLLLKKNMQQNSCKLVTNAKKHKKISPKNDQFFAQKPTIVGADLGAFSI